MRIVVVSPHRDDAAFSLGLAIDAWLASGHKVTVMNCFTISEYAPFSDVASLHANDRRSFVTAVRRREDIAWTKLAGSRLELYDLDLMDAPLRLACSVEDVQTMEIRPGDRAVARVAGAITKIAGRVARGEIAFVVPLAVGGHIDHRVARQAAAQALTDPSIPLAFYEDLPYAARPEARDLLVPEAAMDLQACFASASRPDESAAVARKQRIAECYDSQIDSAAVHSIASFCSNYGGRERIWGNTAWGATQLCANQELQA